MSVFTRFFEKHPKVSNCRTFLSFKWGSKKQGKPCEGATEKRLKPLFYEMFGEDADMPTELQKVVDMKKGDKKQDTSNESDEIPGIKYQAVGSTILLQEDSKLPEPDTLAFNKELRRLERIEAHPTLKDKIGEPFPPTKSAEQRLIDMSDRKLHPLHQKVKTVPKRRVVLCEGSDSSKDGDVAASPKQIYIDKELLERKNILFDLKRVEPPKEMVYRGFEQKLKHLAELRHIPVADSFPRRPKCPLHGGVDKNSEK